MAKPQADILDKTTEFYWQKCVPLGSTVMTSDPQSITEIGRHGIKDPYLTYEVSRIRRVTDMDNLFEFLLFDLASQNKLENLFLMAKCCDGQIDIRLYFAVDIGGAVTRQDMAGSFLFDDPHNNDTTPLLNLKYTDLLVRDGSEFRFKQPGERQGEYRQLPRGAGLDAVMVATFKEWLTDNPGETNPEVFLLESGASGSDTGGLIELFQGCQINPEGDLEIIPNTI